MGLHVAITGLGGPPPTPIVESPYEITKLRFKCIIVEPYLVKILNTMPLPKEHHFFLIHTL